MGSDKIFLMFFSLCFVFSIFLILSGFVLMINYDSPSSGYYSSKIKSLCEDNDLLYLTPEDSYNKIGLCYSDNGIEKKYYPILGCDFELNGCYIERR